MGFSASRKRFVTITPAEYADASETALDCYRAHAGLANLAWVASLQQTHRCTSRDWLLALVLAAARAQETALVAEEFALIRETVWSAWAAKCATECDAGQTADAA